MAFTVLVHGVLTPTGLMEFLQAAICGECQARLCTLLVLTFPGLVAFLEGCPFTHNHIYFRLCRSLYKPNISCAGFEFFYYPQ